MTPEDAYYLAMGQGPSDETRKAACQDPHYAFRYAYHVDTCPRDDTRATSCQDPWAAYWYARDIDQCGRDDTRRAACKIPEWACFYTHKIDTYLHPVSLQAIPSIELSLLQEQFEFD